MCSTFPGAAIPQQEMYKCTDNHGRLLVFRPDTTLPIARMAASRLQGHKKPLRFYYCQNIYRNRPDLSGRSDETAQMGIELMGAGGLRADLEAIATAVAALSACVEDFRVEIGHARFFQVLADQLPVTPRGEGGTPRHHRVQKLRRPLRAVGPPGGPARGPGHGPAAPALRRGGGPRPGGALVPPPGRQRRPSPTSRPSTRPCAGWAWGTASWWT